MSDENPTLADVISSFVAGGAASLRVALPGRIESFDSATQTCSVKPQLKEVKIGQDGKDIIVPLPVINGVPVVSPSGGGFGLEFPVTAGDTCLVIFSDRSIDKWVATGGDVDPEDLRRHHLSDAIAIVGLRHDNNKLSEYDTAAIQLGKQGGPRVRVTDSQVQLGGGNGESPTESAVLGNTYRSNEDTMLTAISKALEAMSAGVVGASGPSSFNPATIALITAATSAIAAFKNGAANYLSTKVKVK